MRWLRLSAISEPVVRVHFVAEATVGRQGHAINRSHQMTVPRTAADVLDDHVTFELECIDRLYLNLYQPKLQHELGVVGFFKGHRGFQFVSSALMDPSSSPPSTATSTTTTSHWSTSVPASAKTTSPSGTLAGHDGAEGILFVGRAQEKTSAFRTEKARR
jgi:hypothetical protein